MDYFLEAQNAAERGEVGVAQALATLALVAELRVWRAEFKPRDANMIDWLLGQAAGRGGAPTTPEPPREPDVGDVLSAVFAQMREAGHAAGGPAK